MMASINSHIFETGISYRRQDVAPDPWSFMTPRPVQCLHCQAMLCTECGGMFFHISLVTQLRFRSSSHDELGFGIGVVWFHQECCTSTLLRSIVFASMVSFISNTPMWCSPFCCWKKPQIRILRCQSEV